VTRRPRRPIRRYARGLGLGAAVLTAGWLCWLELAPPPDPYEVLPAGRQVFARDGTLLRGFLSQDQKWRWRAPLADISPHLVAAIIEHEDRRFHRHPGVDPLAILRAAWTNLRAGRVLAGGSTITMQLARLVEPGRRSFTTKIFQALRALQYEWRYSKDEILEMYLNLTPYGGNIEGVAAASRLYFDKPPAELSLAEACLLAVLPESPVNRHPIRRPQAAARARNRLLARMAARGQVDGDIAARALAQPLPARMCALPFRAPHFCEWAIRRHPEPVNLHTTLDASLQSQAENLLAAHVDQLVPAGIRQGAALIVDYGRSELLAMVGSAGYFDSLHAGQVNGTLARRSPGSTLKPFVYALAFERGLATPATLLEDVPVRLGSYAPENYDGVFVGAIPAGRALQTSRNVPAILLAAGLHQDGAYEGGLYGWLVQAGVASLDRAADHYGLGLALGGCEITLQELVDLYGLLARQGLQRPTRLLMADKPDAASVRLLSREAAWLTLHELVDVERPESHKLWRAGVDAVPIPWKTGTSYRHRDAWSVGIAGRCVVGVWMGNFDGRSSSHLVGSKVAAPLLFDLVELLPPDQSGAWRQRPSGLQEIEVCALSGAPCSPNCPETRVALVIPGVSPSAPCDWHRRIMIDTETGCEVCTRCRAERRWEPRLVTWWPPRLATFWAAQDTSGRELPPHNPLCPRFGAREAPTIVSPQPRMEYHLRAGVPLEDQQIALIAAVSRASRDVYWFLDGDLIGTARPGQTFFWRPTPGEHRLSVKDDAGRVTTTAFNVVD
jgi:penicillin-binding protein 1C